MGQSGSWQYLVSTTTTSATRMLSGKPRRSPRNAKTALYHPPKPCEGPCVIERLPSEILREIYALIFDCWVVPLALFLVNRRWNEVACGHSLLRSVIHIRKAEEYLKNFTEYEKPVFCTSSSHLSRALAHIGDAKFTLYITYIPGDIVLRNYPLENRCRELHLNIYWGDSWPLLLPRLTALVELNLGDSTCPDFLVDHDRKELMEELELSATSLKALRLFGPWLPNLPHRSKLLGGLRDMHLLTSGALIRKLDMETLIDGMKNLDFLVWEQSSSLPCPIVSIPNSVTTLHLIGVPEITIWTAKNLVHLYVNYGPDEKWHRPTDPVSDFPLLESLALRGSWVDLPRIRTPILHELFISEAYENNMSMRELVPLVQVKTKALCIDAIISDSNLKSLLANVWSDLEELHWICPGEEPLGESLARALAGGPKAQPLCPKLKYLTVEVKFSEEVDPYQFRRSVERLERIVKGRKHQVSDILESVRCGWRNTEMLNDDEDELDAVMTWFSVL